MGKPKPVWRRFWARVQFTPGCWLWTGGKQSNGYGQLSVAGRGVVYTHRLSFELFNGPIPPGLQLLHACDNPSCVNPDHLSPGTQEENNADRHRKGRSVKGERHGMARLTLERVREIRVLAAAGGIKQCDLAAEYGISEPHLSGILAGKFWKENTGQAELVRNTTAFQDRRILEAKQPSPQAEE